MTHTVRLRIKKGIFSRTKGRHWLAVEWTMPVPAVRRSGPKSNKNNTPGKVTSIGVASKPMA